MRGGLVDGCGSHNCERLRCIDFWEDARGYKTGLPHVNVELRVRIDIDASLSVDSAPLSFDSAPLSFDSAATIRPFQVDLVG